MRSKRTATEFLLSAADAEVVREEREGIAVADGLGSLMD